MGTFTLRPIEQQDIIDNVTRGAVLNSQVRGLLNRPSQLFTEVNTANTLRFNGKIEPFGGYNKGINAEDITFSAFPTTQAVTNHTGVSANVGEFVVLQAEYLASSGSVTLTQNNYYYYLGGGIAGTVGTIYKRIAATSTADISTFDFTSADFTAHGTNEKYQCIQDATTQDLTNTTYFRPVDDITVQQALIPSYDPSTDTTAWVQPTYLAEYHQVGKNYTNYELMFKHEYALKDAFRTVLELTQLTASDAQGGDYFGIAVALYGDKLVVGAQSEDTAASDAGKVYIYEWNGSSYVEIQQITASDAQTDDYFGNSIALYGDKLVVGAYSEDTAATNAGKVYVYEWNGSSYVEIQQITASDAQGSDLFGSSVAMYGDKLVVGAQSEDTAATNAGKVYVYEWNGSSYVEIQQITASDAQTDDRFGSSVAMYGDKLVVGAHLEDTAATNAGKVYIYEWNGSSYTELTQITASDAQADDRFGISAALNGDKLVVGAHLEGTAATNAGKVYIYEWNGSSYVEIQQITASDAQTDDRFGISVALYGDKLVVGAYSEDTAATNAGKVYVYTSTSHAKDTYIKGFDGKLYGAPFVWQRLNNGKYSPFSNPYGQYNGSDSNDWHASTDSFTSAYDCFVSIGTAEGRPETGYVLDKVYLNQIVARPQYLGKPTWSDQLEAVQELINGTWEYAVDCDLAMATGAVATASSYAYSAGVHSKFVFAAGALGTLQAVGDRTAEKVYGKLLSGTTVYEIVEIAPNESGFDNVYVRLSYSDLGTPTLTDISVQVYTETANLSRGTHTHVDMIGHPTNYPQVLKDILASGKSVSGVNALLVNQDGTSAIPDGVTPIYYTFSKKAFALSLALITDTPTLSWSTSSSSFTRTGNYYFTTSLTDSATKLRLLVYEARNSVTQDAVITTKPIGKVGDMVASNSHSWYRGNALIYSSGIGVGTGNGVANNSVVALAIDNTNETYTYKATIGRALSVQINETVQVDSNFPDAISGVGVYQNITGGAINYTPSALNTMPTSSWKFIGYTDSIPSHAAITLDSSGNKAAKTFIISSKAVNTGESVLDIYTQELVWDTTLDNRAEFTAITVTTATTYNAETMYYLNNAGFGTLNQKVLYCKTTTGSLDAATLEATLFEDGEGNYRDAAGTIYFTSWDGNGFGDLGTFDQLRNGVDTDANGNTIITSHTQVQL